MNGLNLIDKYKLKKEKKKYNYYFKEIMEFVTPEFIKQCPNEQERKKIYDFFQSNKEEFIYFLKIYGESQLIAKEVIKNDCSLNETCYNYIKTNKIKLEKIINNNISLQREAFLDQMLLDKYIDIFNYYGKGISTILNMQNLKYLENECTKRLETTYIVDNIERIRNTLDDLEKCSSKETENILFNLSISNNEKYKLLITYFSTNLEKYSADILLFFQENNYELDVIETIKEQEITTFDKLLRYYTYRFNPEFENNIGTKISDFIIKVAKEKNNVYLYKKILLEKIFGDTIISNYNKFYNTKNPEIKKYIECIHKIDNSKSIESIENIITQNNISISKFEFQKLLFNDMHEQLSDNLFVPPITDKNNKEDVTIIKAEDINLTNFNMLVHTITDRKSCGSPNGNLSLELVEKPELWTNTDKQGSDFLCCSYISENNTNTFGDAMGGIILGFSNIKGAFISGVDPGDAGSNMKGKGIDFTSHNKTISDLYFLPHQLNDALYLPSSKRTHNEITIARTINNKKITPSFMIIKKNFYKGNCSLNNNTKKWAKYYNIPIIEIDADIIYAKAKEDFKNNTEILNNNIISLENFEKVLKNIRTIENCKGNLFNIYDIIISLINKTYGDMNNYNGLMEIINKYGLSCEPFIKNEYFDNTKKENKVIIDERKKIIKEKLDYLNKMYSINISEEMDKTHKLGYVITNYIYSTLFVIFVLLTLIMIFLYTRM